MLTSKHRNADCMSISNGLSIKTSTFREKFVQYRHFSDNRGFFRCGRPHFLVQKTSDFSKFMVCPLRQGGG